MSKKIFCRDCGTLVATLTKGSTWKNGSVCVCKECAKEVKLKAFKDNMESVYKKNSPLGDMFGGMFG